MIRDALYHLDMFRRFVQDEWLNRSSDPGPFVLIHGDMEPFNLLISRDAEIVGVLDWEWSRVVPVQFFKPPLWLRMPDITLLAWDIAYKDYLKGFDELLAAVRR